MRTILISRRRRREPRSVPTSVSITVFKEQLELGEVFQFEAVVLDQVGDPVDGAVVSWGSSDTDVATVSGGLVEAVGLGSVDIVVSYEGLTSSKTIETELGAADEVTIAPSTLTIDANESDQFSAQAFNAFGVEIPGVSFQWSTTDEDVAVVDSSGEVEAYGPGTATISASVDGVTGTATITVEGEVADVVASYDQILLLNPDVDVMFRLPRYRGQQILFQDSDCTVPVTAPGDPVGGVLSIDTLERTAFAQTSADRFVWLGEDQGAHMNKDRLTIDKAPEYWDFLKDGMWTIASGTKVVSEADGSGWRALYGEGSTASSKTRTIQFNYGHSTPRYYAVGYNTSALFLTDEEIVFDQYQGLVFTSDGTYLNFFQDKQVGRERDAIHPDWVDSGAPDNPFYIGGSSYAPYNFNGVSSGFIFIKAHADASLVDELTDLLTVGLKND